MIPWIQFLSSISVILLGPAVLAAESVDERNHLMGDWGGVRSEWVDQGLHVELVYTAEYFENFNGGIKEGGDYRGDLSLFIELDTAKAGWWENGDFFIHIQEQHGDGITERYVGDLQGVSNIDADDFLQISEFWYTHYFMDERLWLKFGKQEANADFAYVEHGGEFINSSAGFSPSIPLTTYPNQDFGAVLGIVILEQLSVKLGAYQARPNGSRSLGNTIDKLHGPMWMVEPTIHYSLNGKPGDLRLGYWRNDDEVDRLDGNGSADHMDGYYLNIDQTLVQDDEGNQILGMFAQYAKSDEDYVETETYYGAGLVWNGPFDSREEDLFGVGMYRAELSSDAGFERDHETVYELFYKVQVTPWCSVKPDLQYIVHPGGSTKSDATVLGMRAEITF